VGVGPWGSLLARKLTGAGALVAWYVRNSGPDVEGLGQRVTIDSLWQPGRVDGIVIAAPPEITLQLARQAAAAGMAVLATKPLQLPAPVQITAPFFVDYVRLWAKGYTQLKALVAGHAIEKIQIEFFGPGPWRTFSSLDDFGSHALAFVHDLLGSQQVLTDLQASPVRHFERNATLHAVKARVGDTDLALEVGNGAEFRRLRLLVVAKGLGSVVYEEAAPNGTLMLNGEMILSEPQDPLAAMSAQFIEHAAQGLVDERFVNLSVAVTRSLAHIHQAEALVE
jgi:predicted dehydrogenase